MATDLPQNPQALAADNARLRSELESVRQQQERTASLKRAAARQLLKPTRIIIHPDDIPLARQTPAGRMILASAGYSYDTTEITHEDEPGIMPGRPAAAGFPGLNVSAGVVSQEYNARILRLADRLQVYEEMRRSDTSIAAMEWLVTTPVAQCEFFFKGGNDEALSEFLTWNLASGLSLPFSETAREAALAPFYGFTWCYPTYMEKQYGGKTWMGWDQFEPRLRNTTYQWRLHDNGRFKGLIQYGSHPVTGEPMYVSYDAEEIIKWTWRGDGGDPEGLGAFRQAFRAYSEKSAAKEWAMMRLERVAAPIPVGECKDGYSYNDEDAAIVMTMLGNIRMGRAQGLTIPEGWLIRLLDLGTADVPFGEHIERLSVEIKETILAHFVNETISLGSKDQSNLFASIVLEGVADWLCDWFNVQETPRICRMNGYLDDDRPQLAHTQVLVKDPEKYMMALEKITRHPENIPADAMAVASEELGLPPPDPDAQAQALARIQAMKQQVAPAPPAV